MKRSLGFLLFLSVAAAGCEEAPVGPTFIAQQSDFADFQSWPRYSFGDTTVAGLPTGPRFGYLKQKAPPGATAYPVGSMIVKSVEVDATPQDWELFGMVKRGGGYNSAGALDWEYFTLRLSIGGVPVIFSRGFNPIDLDSVDGGAGHGYGDTSGTGITCNRCHGAAGTERFDHILSGVLAPGAPGAP
jgi:hypothetical protein